MIQEPKTCTGSLQIKGGIWYTVIQITIGGVRKSKWETTRLKARGNKRKAQAILDERKAQYELKYMSGSGGNLDNCKEDFLLFNEYLRRWTLSQRTGVAYATNSSRESMTNGRIKAFFAPRGITQQKLSALDIEDFYEELRLCGLSGTTLVHYHQFMNQALEAAVRKDILEKNPMKKIDRPKKKNFTGNFYTKEEVARLLELFCDDPLYPLIVTAVYYGMRRSELLGLQWDCVDFGQNTISVERKVYKDAQKGDARGLMVSDELKSKNTRRTLPLVPAVREVLLSEKACQEERRRLFRTEYCCDYKNMVFVNSIGELFTPDFVSRHFRVIVNRSKLKNVRFHDLRHTCASLLVSSGIDMKLIQHWLGHANYSTTATFTHI